MMNLLKASILSSFFFVIGNLPAGARDTVTKGFINYALNHHYGAMMPHNTYLKYLNQENIKSIETNIWFEHPTSQQAGNVTLGSGYIFSNLGNYKVFGNMHAFFFGLRSPRLFNKLPVQYKIGLGVGYATKNHNPDSKYLNLAIGSHLNAYGQLSLSGRIRTGHEKWILRPGISFHHLSNGKIVAPNMGLNLLTFHIGLELHSHHTHSGAMLIERKKSLNERNRFIIMVAPGIKQVHSRVDQKIFASGLIFDYSYLFLAESSIGIGVNFFYNDTWSIYPYNLATPDAPPPPFQSSLHLSLQQDLGHISFILHPGIYIYKPSDEIPRFANRLGVKYSLKNNFSVQFSIKHHWFARADYFEWGVGYEIKW